MPIDDLSNVKWDDDGPGLTIDITGGVRESDLAPTNLAVAGESSGTSAIDPNTVQWDDEGAGKSGMTREQRQAEIAQVDQALDYENQLAGLNRQEGIGRSLGLGGRAMLEGLASIPDLVVAPAVAGIEYMTRPDPTMADLVAGRQPEGVRFGTIREGVSALADMVGAPRPENATERVASDMTGAISGAATGVGLGRQLARSGAPVVAGIGEALAANPYLQMLSAGTGAGAASATREAGGGVGAQLAAGLAGGLAPAAISAGAPAVVRGAIRGGEAGRQRMAENIAAFEQAGTSPSVGQATERPIFRGVEQTLSRVPGSASLMVRRAGARAEQIGQGLEDTAASLSPRTTAGEAGRAVQKGITGSGGFIESRRQVANDLYDAVDRYMPAAMPVPMTNTQTTLKKLTGLTPGAESTTAAMVNPKIAQINRTIGEDLLANLQLSKQNGLPYEAVKELRSRVGRMLEGNELIAEAPKAELKQLYGALSRDLESASKEAGPQAAQAVSRANNYWKSLQSRVDVLDSAVNKAGGPEKVFNALWSGSKDGDTTLRAVMQSLPKEGQRDVAAAFVRRLGRANPGAQNEAGDAFNAQTFLTNWNKISPEAKKTLFSRFGPGFTDSMNKIAKVASNLREGSQAFANPSGTAAAGAQIAGLTSFVTSLATGNVGLAAGIGGSAAAANLWARAMTNPRFVAWLANQTKTPVGALPAQMQVLRTISEKHKEPELAQIADLIDAEYTQQQNPENQQRGQ